MSKLRPSAVNEPAQDHTGCLAGGKWLQVYSIDSGAALLPIFLLCWSTDTTEWLTIPKLILFHAFGFLPKLFLLPRMPYPWLLPCLVSRVNTNLPFNTQSMCTSQGGLTFPSPLPLYSILVSINLLIIFFYTINCNKSALLCPHCAFSKGRNRVLFTSEFPEPGTQRRSKYLLNW